MGLREDIENAVNEAYDTDLADAVEQFTHEAIEITGYDAGSGVNRITLTDEGRGVFTSFTKEELADEHILPTDVKLVVFQSEFTNQLAVDDLIIRIEKNKTFKVIGWKEDPAKVLYLIQLRSVADAG